MALPATVIVGPLSSPWSLRVTTTEIRLPSLPDWRAVKRMLVDVSKSVVTLAGSRM